MDITREMAADHLINHAVEVEIEPDVELANRLAQERDKCLDREQILRGDAERATIEANRYGRMAKALEAALNGLLPQKIRDTGEWRQGLADQRQQAQAQPQQAPFITG